MKFRVKNVPQYGTLLVEFYSVPTTQQVQDFLMGFCAEGKLFDGAVNDNYILPDLIYKLQFWKKITKITEKNWMLECFL